MEFLVLLGITAAIVMICLVGMGVGYFIRRKGFTSCGNASITYRGERIDCPACENSEAGSCAAQENHEAAEAQVTEA